MTNRAAGHGEGFDAIEFVAQFLPLLPFEEFGERHRLSHSEVHLGHCTTLPRGNYFFFRWATRGTGRSGG
jgi:hypothetical protein